MFFSEREKLLKKGHRATVIYAKTQLSGNKGM
jgi:hypothetical protein